MKQRYTMPGGEVDDPRTEALAAVMAAVEDYAVVPYLTAKDGPDEYGEYECRHYPDPQSGEKIAHEQDKVRRAVREYAAAELEAIVQESEATGMKPIYQLRARIAELRQEA